MFSRSSDGGFAYSLQYKCAVFRIRWCSCSCFILIIMIASVTCAKKKVEENKPFFVSVSFKLITQMKIKQFIFVFRLIFQFNIHLIFNSIIISHSTRCLRRHYKWGAQNKKYFWAKLINEAYAIANLLKCLSLFGKGSITYLSFGLTLLTAGITTIAFPIYDLVLEERLKMQPGLPPYEQWVIPQPEVRLRVFIFEADNPNEFLNGTDEKLRLREIGPIVYREHVHHKDVIFHKNSTLSYTAARRIEFLEDQNEPDILNRTILVPNFVVLVGFCRLFLCPNFI